MAVKRYYSSTAIDTTLASSCTSSDTTIVVSSTTGFPSSYPYTLALGYDTSTEELVNVVGASGTTLTLGTTVGVGSVTGRGTDNTTAQIHAAGSVVKHVISGRDLRETQAHYDASGYYSVVNGAVTDTFNLHGIGSGEGSVVGTDKAQALTNKTISGSSNTISNIGNSSLTNSSITVNGSSVSLGGTVTVTATPTDGTVTDAKIVSGGLAASSLAGSIPDSKLNTITTSGKVNTSAITGTLAVANGGTGVTTSTGSGAVVLGTSPTLAGASIGGGTISGSTISGTPISGASISGSTLSNVTVSGVLGTPDAVPTQVGAGGTSYTVPANATNILVSGAPNATITLPTATAGRELRVLNVTGGSGTVISASSNVYSRTTGTLGTAICSGTRGSWALLVADGTNWYIMAGA